MATSELGLRPGTRERMWTFANGRPRTREADRNAQTEQARPVERGTRDLGLGTGHGQGEALGPATICGRDAAEILKFVKDGRTSARCTVGARVGDGPRSHGTEEQRRHTSSRTSIANLRTPSIRAVLAPLDDNAAAATEPLIPPPMISTSNASDSNFWICSFRSDISKVFK